MKIVLVTGSTTSVNIIKWLNEQGVLSGVLFENGTESFFNALSNDLSKWNIKTYSVKKNGLDQACLKWFHSMKPDLVIVFGFSMIIPKQFFETAKFGFYNIHFSLLPSYKGPAPVFWQLKNGEKLTGVSLHEMTEKVDSGFVLLQLPYQIQPTDMYGILHLRLTEMVIPMIYEFLHTKMYASKQKRIAPYIIQDSYEKRPGIQDLKIEWASMEAFQVVNLIKATNPSYQGALTFYKGNEVRILKGSVYKYKMETNNTLEPGQLIQEDNQLLVICKSNTVLKIDIIANMFGVINGEDWKSVFVHKHEKPSIHFFT